MRIVKAASITDFRELARRKLPHFQFEYVDGGSYAETTLGWNIADLRKMAGGRAKVADMLELTPAEILASPTAH